MSKRIPATSAQWLEELGRAIDDARDALLFVDSPDGGCDDATLFHFAPLVCLKFRGLDYRNESLRKKVTEGALATDVANSGDNGTSHELARRPLLAFALCYVTAHYVHVLDLV